MPKKPQMIKAVMQLTKRHINTFDEMLLYFKAPMNLPDEVEKFKGGMDMYYVIMGPFDNEPDIEDMIK